MNLRGCAAAADSAFWSDHRIGAAHSRGDRARVSAAPGPALLPQSEATILILGSKPQPCLPQPAAYSALACANASGFSARAHGLRAPLFTVVSAVLGSGNASDRHSLAALDGLEAGRVYFLPRPLPKTFWRRLRYRLRNWRLQAPWVRHLLRRHGLRFQEFVQRPTGSYDGLLLRLAGNTPELAELVGKNARRPALSPWPSALPSWASATRSWPDSTSRSATPTATTR